METREKDSKAKKTKDTISNVNKPEATNTGGREYKAGERASVKPETNAGGEKTDMAKHTPESGTDESQQPTRQRSSDRSSGQKPEQGTPRGSAEEGKRTEERGRYGRDGDDLYSDYERGFRDGSQHAARWYSQRNFEREQNSFGEYDPAYNPTGINTERSGSREQGRYSDYGNEERGFGDRSGYHHQRYESGDYLNRNVGYSNQGRGGGYSRGGGYYQGYSDPGYYQGARQSYPNQDRYDPDRDFDDLRRNPDREEQRLGHVNPDRGGYEEGGYEYSNRPPDRDDSYTQEQGLSGRRDPGANRYGASPRDYDRARRREMNYGDRSNYQASEDYRGTSASPRYDRPVERRGEERQYKKRGTVRSGSDWYDDPYREYDWSSRE